MKILIEMEEHGKQIEPCSRKGSKDRHTGEALTIIVVTTKEDVMSPREQSANRQDSAPGAYACGFRPEFARELGNTVTRRIETISPTLAEREIPTMTGLVEARPVAESEELDFETAVPFNGEEMNRSDRQDKDWRLFCIVSGIAVVIGALLASTVLIFGASAVVSSQLRDKIGPASSPTSSPSLSEDGFLSSLLHKDTLQTIQMDPNSPQSIAFNWMVQDPHLDSYTSERLLQRFALATFYYATNPNHSSWTRDDHWLDYEISECEWYLTSHDDLFQRQPVVEETACNKDGFYVRLWLYNNNIAGTLPEELSLLSRLESLDLVSNPELSGNIPTRLLRMTTLTSLGLRKNALTGTLPSELGLLTQLTVLYFGEQQDMYGTFPTEPFSRLTNLQQMAIGGSKSHTGTLPTEVGKLTNLVALGILGTSLSGPIPSQVGQMSTLKYLFMAMNQFSGTIPTELGQLEQLRWLNFQKSRLMGPVPSQLGRLTGLQELVFGDNQLLSTLPTELGHLKQLYKMSFEGNTLTGRIPSQVGNLVALTHLSGGGGQFSGHLPSELGQLAKLEHLNLAENQLSGTLPSTLGALDNLEEFWLNNNALTGTLPLEMESLRDTLVQWDFTRNNFSANETWSILSMQNRSSEEAMNYPY